MDDTEHRGSASTVHFARQYIQGMAVVVFRL
jgi:hypothetical protein